MSDKNPFSQAEARKVADFLRERKIEVGNPFNTIWRKNADQVVEWAKKQNPKFKITTHELLVASGRIFEAMDA